ncbi:MAG: hypothetical protein R2713_14620 [Ilumatobacteraceae bacterium]
MKDVAAVVPRQPTSTRTRTAGAAPSARVPGDQFLVRRGDQVQDRMVGNWNQQITWVPSTSRTAAARGWPTPATGAISRTASGVRRSVWKSDDPGVPTSTAARSLEELERHSASR